MLSPVPRAIPLVPWPARADERARLAAAGRPRILVLAPGEPPPESLDALEDWVREPLDHDEIEARSAVLARRHRSAPPVTMVVLDGDGILRRGARLVVLLRGGGLLLDQLAELPRAAPGPATRTRADSWRRRSQETEPK